VTSTSLILAHPSESPPDEQRRQLAAVPTSQRRAQPPPVDLCDRLHLDMLSATMAGRGLQGVAELAAEPLGIPVAIVIPGMPVAVAPPLALAEEEISKLTSQVLSWLATSRREPPASVLAHVPVRTADEIIGAVLALQSEGPDQRDVVPAESVLKVAAIAAVAEMAVAAARDEHGDEMRSSVIEQIRTDVSLTADGVIRLGQQVGIDLSAGAIAVCAEISTGRPRYALEVLRTNHPGVLAELHGRRIYALLPALPPPASEEDQLNVGQSVSDALEPYGRVAFSSFRGPAMFRHSIKEAETVLALLEHEDTAPARELDTTTYRLLFHTLTAHPEEVMRVYEGTVAPLVRYDDQYNTDLVMTVASYLEHGCNTNATASAMFAHRHTIAYRLERVRELTNLDLNRSEHRERLGLGLKAYRLLAPRLARSSRFERVRESVASAAR
jgi:sugar diacid utilization regulator